MSGQVRIHSPLSNYLHGISHSWVATQHWKPEWKKAEDLTRKHTSFSCVELTLLHIGKYGELGGGKPSNIPGEYRALAERAAQTVGVAYMSEGFRIVESRWVSEALKLVAEGSHTNCREYLTMFGLIATPPVEVPPLPLEFVIPQVVVQAERRNPIQLAELVPESQPLTPPQEDLLFSYLELHLIYANSHWKPYCVSHPIPKTPSATYNASRRYAIAVEQKSQQARGGTDELIAQLVIAGKDMPVTEHKRHLVSALAQILIEKAAPQTALRVLTGSDQLDWAQYEAYKMLQAENFLTGETGFKAHTKGRFRTKAEDSIMHYYTFHFERLCAELREIQLAKDRVTLVHAVAQQFIPAHARALQRLNALSAEFPQNGAWPVIRQALDDAHKDHACIDAWIMARHKTEHDFLSVGLVPLPAYTLINAVKVPATPAMMDLCSDFCLDALESMEALLQQGNAWQPLNAEQSYDAIYGREPLVNNLVDHLMEILVPTLISPIGRECAWEYVHARIPEVLRDNVSLLQLDTMYDSNIAPRIAQQILEFTIASLDANIEQRAQAYSSLATGLLHAIRVGEILAPKATPKTEYYSVRKIFPDPVKGTIYVNATSLSHFMANRIARAPGAAEQIGIRINERLAASPALADFMAYVNTQAKKR